MPSLAMTRLDEIYERLHDVDNVDRAVEAISIMETEATEDWLPTLHEWLARLDDFFLREAIAPAVIRLEGISCLPRLLHAMHLGRREGHDCDSLQACIIELIESAPLDARTRLLDLAESAADEDRDNAAWLLGFVHQHITPKVLIRLASDKSPDVRQSACGSLASFKGDDRVFDALSRCLADSDEQVRLSAVSSLGYLGDRRALPLLLPLQRSASHRLQHILPFAIEQLQK